MRTQFGTESFETIFYCARCVCMGIYITILLSLKLSSQRPIYTVQAEKPRISNNFRTHAVSQTVP